MVHPNPPCGDFQANAAHSTVAGTSVPFRHTHTHTHMHNLICQVNVCVTYVEPLLVAFGIALYTHTHTHT